MATFPENLAKIQNAVLGEDMRDAIHDAVEQAYDHGSEITIDSSLSDISENPVQNKTITEEITTIKNNMMNIKIVDGKLIINTGGD